MIKSLVKSDHITFKRRRIRALSPLWWVVRAAQAFASIALIWALYWAAWLIGG